MGDTRPTKTWSMELRQRTKEAGDVDVSGFQVSLPIDRDASTVCRVLLMVVLQSERLLERSMQQFCVGQRVFENMADIIGMWCGERPLLETHAAIAVGVELDVRERRHFVTGPADCH